MLARQLNERRQLMKRKGKVAGQVTYLPFLSDDLSHCDDLNWVCARPNRGPVPKEGQPFKPKKPGTF